MNAVQCIVVHRKRASHPIFDISQVVYLHVSKCGNRVNLRRASVAVQHANVATGCVWPVWYLSVHSQRQHPTSSFLTSDAPAVPPAALLHKTQSPECRGIANYIILSAAVQWQVTFL